MFPIGVYFFSITRQNIEWNKSLFALIHFEKKKEKIDHVVQVAVNIVHQNSIVR